jgi:hypothetical protein
MKSLNNWEKLDRFLIEESVSRLQIKIYQAALINDLDKIHKTQTLLLRSPVAKYLAIKLLTENNFSNLNKVIVRKISVTFLERLFFARRLKLFYNKNSTLLSNFPECIALENTLKDILVYLVLSPQWEAYSFQLQIKSVSSSIEAISLVKKYLNSTPKWVLVLDFKHLLNLSPEKLIRQVEILPLIYGFFRSRFKKGSLNLTTELTLMKVLLLKSVLYKLPQLIIRCLGSIEKNNTPSLNFLYLSAYTEILILHPNRDSLCLLKIKLYSFLKGVGFQFDYKEIKILNILGSLKKKIAE